MSLKISEQAILFGRRNSLVGIVAKAVSGPAPDAAVAGRPAIVILNTGIIHRVGHHRMYVTLSRSLAAAGHTVLRFDFSGIGDSEPRSDTLSPVSACLADIGDAMDWLEQHARASRVVLIGLCSGADHAVLYGHTDPRIVGLVLMDPSIPATWRYYVHYVAPRIARFRGWVNMLTGRSRSWQIWTRQVLRIAQSGGRARHPGVHELIPREDIERHYQNCVDAGIALLAVLTEETTRQTYREQMIDALPRVAFGTALKLEFFPGSDHTFALESDRLRLIDLIGEWMDERREIAVS